MNETQIEKQNRIDSLEKLLKYIHEDSFDMGILVLTVFSSFYLLIWWLNSSNALFVGLAFGYPILAMIFSLVSLPFTKVESWGDYMKGAIVGIILFTILGVGIFIGLLFSSPWTF